MRTIVVAGCVIALALILTSAASAATLGSTTLVLKAGTGVSASWGLGGLNLIWDPLPPPPPPPPLDPPGDLTGDLPGPPLPPGDGDFTLGGLNLIWDPLPPPPPPPPGDPPPPGG